MNPQITSENAYDFLNRFFCFYDAVFNSISIKYDKNGQRDLNLSITARDSLASEEKQWIELIITIKDVRELTIREKCRTSLQVLLEGLRISWPEGCVALEFGGASEPPKTLGEFRDVDGYVIGREISYYIKNSDDT